MFISFEGGDGGGKTTQLRLLADALRGAGREVVATREPGGAPGAEEIRRLVLEGAPGRWSAVSELLLFNAARREHLERTIRPALARGAVVLCDRFADSTRVYQGLGRDSGEGAPPEMVEALHALVIGLEPDLTLILELPPEEALARAEARMAGASAAQGGAESRFERFGADFQSRVRDGFRALAAAHPARCRLVDASGAPEEVQGRIRAAALPLLPELSREDA
ncbi:dTMP kinase [Rhodovulum sp. DZ06]|uniref:dTMP kinase n=1 Tax=Rhodovulum sp. DZ06 TaxID=3425126 RepID=UPI003D34B94F